MRAAAFVALGIALAAAAHAQAPAPAQPAQAQEAKPPDWIRPESVPAQADALLAQIESAHLDPAKQSRADEIERSFAELAPRIDQLAARVQAAVAGGAALEKLDELSREITSTAAALDKWQDVLETEAERVGAVSERLGIAQATWTATLARPEIAHADPVVARRVRASIDLLREASAEQRTWSDRILALEDQIVERRGELTTELASVQESADVQRTALLTPSRPPIWRRDFWAQLNSELPGIPERLGEFAIRNREYLRDVRPFVVQTLLAALLAWGLRRAGRAARERSTSLPELTRTALVLERPISIAVLVALLLSPWLHPLAPRVFVQLLALIALVPAWRVIEHVSAVKLNRLVFAGLFALLVVDRVRLGLEELPAAAQALFLAELLIGMALVLRVMRRSAALSLPAWFHNGAQIILAALGLAMLAEIGGWSGLATMLGRAALGTGLFAVYAWAVIAGLDALIEWVLRSPRWSRFVADDPREAQQRARRVVRWLTVATWVFLVLGNTGLRVPVMNAVRALLAAGVSIGELSVTLGGVLAFALTIVLAPVAARFVNASLETAVYPRAHLPRGMPFALSRMVRYAVFGLAFLAALAAAGVKMDQLSILLGGLGVGLGLGLQDFVKNFAAGITILFERRVHVGDVVEIPSSQVSGRVSQIGMRAVQVRNWDGADVIVPNIELIATAVTNWTLSDRLRRIELPVGVGYESDPAQVIELLLAVARAHADVVAQPEPMALFLGFGESSLSFVLRAWTDSDYDRTSALRSELALAVQRTLHDAGISLPFPQRDLHLASIAPAVRAAIQRNEAK